MARANVLFPLQASCEEARFQCTRKLMEVNGRKRYEFLEAAVSAVDAHLRFFERRAEVSTLFSRGPARA